MTVGLDQGASCIKIAAITQTPRRRMITALAQFPLPGQAEGDAIEKSVVKQIHRWVADHGLTGAHASLGAPMSLVTLKWVSLPPMPSEDLQSAARAKVRRELPYPIDQAFVAASALPGEGGECLVMAAPKNALSLRARTVETLGLNPVHAEPEAQAIVRLIGRRSTLQRGGCDTASYTVVDLGWANTRMYVVQEGALKFARSIRFGASSFIHRLVEGLRISDEQAEVLASSPGAYITSGGSLRVPLGSDEASVGVDEELVVLTREVTRLIRYFRSIFPARSFSGMMDRFVLCGGMAGLPGLAQFLGNQIQTKVSLLDPFDHVDLDLPSEAFLEGRTCPSRFGAAIGLALAPRGAAGAHQEDEDGYLWAKAA